MQKRVVIMAGGTGGHIFPALALAHELQQRGNEILWLGTRGRLEEVLVVKHGFNIAYIEVQGLRGNGLKRLLKAPCMLFKSICAARKIIKDFKADYVIGMGGYASGPGGVAAYLLGLKVYVHEQNAAAGLTNKLLSKLATKIFLGFQGAFSGAKVSYVGNPVRAEIVALYHAFAKRQEQVQREGLKILLVGGSLGAKALNDLVPLALKGFGQDVSILHQCGKGNSSSVQEIYAQEQVQCHYQVQDFIDDMAQAYDSSDIIICRAGALTVAEVAVAGIPAIFVPLPTAVDDHQRKNALYLVEGGGAKLILQQDLKAEDLHNMLQQMLEHKEILAQMQIKQHELAIIDSTKRIIDEIEHEQQ